MVGLCLADASRCFCGRGNAPGRASFAHRFDRVEQLIRTRYYAHDLNGVGWTALCARYRPLAATAEAEGEWYQTVNAMLQELGDAHTRALRPAVPRRQFAREAGTGVPSSADFPCSRVLPDGVVWLRFGRFDAATMRWLQREIAAHERAPGLIIDLRDNPGGLVGCTQQAVGLFFADRVPMGWVIAREGRRTLERSRQTPHTRFMGPLAVLVGPGSRSSAEVFAYVMQHHARAVVVGQTTAGQVLGARPYRLPDGGQLYVSVSDFHRFDHGRLEGEGVHPDIGVASPALFDDDGHPDQSADEAITAALEVLRSRAGTSKDVGEGTDEIGR